jgi:hypothetical protein
MDRIELTSATLFEALQGLANDIRKEMGQIDRDGGTPDEAQLTRVRDRWSSSSP